MSVADGIRQLKEVQDVEAKLDSLYSLCQDSATEFRKLADKAKSVSEDALSYAEMLDGWADYCEGVLK